jgi:hypothetical protein
MMTESTWPSLTGAIVLNHLIGAHQNGRGNADPQRFGRFQVYRELE